MTGPESYTLFGIFQFFFVFVPSLVLWLYLCMRLTPSKLICEYPFLSLFALIGYLIGAGSLVLQGVIAVMDIPSVAARLLTGVGLWVLVCGIVGFHHLRGNLKEFLL